MEKIYFFIFCLLALSIHPIYGNSDTDTNSTTTSIDSTETDESYSPQNTNGPAVPTGAICTVKSEENDCSTNLQNWVIWTSAAGTTLALIGVIGLALFYSLKIDKDIKKLYGKYRQLKETTQENSLMQDNDWQLDKLRNKLEDCEKKIAALTQQIEEIKQNKQVQQSTTTATQPTNERYYYAKTFKDGILKSCTEDNSQYKLTHSSNKNEFEFEICGNNDAILSNIDAVIKGYADTNGDRKGARSISTLQKGKAIEQADGTWKVIQKAILKCE